MTEADTLERPAGAPLTAVLRVDRDALLAAVRAVSQTVERRNTIPILSNVMLRAADSFLTICASDLDHWSMRTIDCAGAKIDTTVEADRLITAIDTLRPGAVDISHADGALTIKQGRSSRKLMTLPSTDFPMPKPLAHATSFAIDAAPLLKILDTARVAVSTEETRYYLCGVFLQIEDDKLVAAATDGHRVVQVKHPAPAGAAGMGDSIIGTKAVNLICRFLADAEDGAQVELALSDKFYRVGTGRASIEGKIIDATYPDYRRVLREEHDAHMTIQSAEFDRTIRAAGCASDGKTRGVRMDLSRNHCEASATAQDGSRSVEPMDGSYDGPTIAVGVNAMYAQSIAKMFGQTPTLKLGFAGEAAVIVITSDDRPGVTAGVMPMRA
ncbi:DNA polymerase III subunit beta [Sphingobium yanoikuyae]|uniref:DNA polymerase III subunit beta n=1 Tax=Sphingobium yanoikuyae TaxID=13690 RepID=UPI0022DD781C|nr:DNA polymerase III subunit beta [Sphingobium yanoikuyae]WBQ17494.1 DNA polymerase III subunit beta [Sphingobium yanoikuyae]